MQILSIDELARIELEFTDDEGVFHFIWVEPNDLEKT